jgi:hypothetical protein
MSRKSRVRNIMISLTPKQAAINYVTQLQRFGSLADYCASPRDQGRVVPGLMELTGQIKDAVEDAFPEGDGRELAMAVKAGVEEVTFLVFLHDHIIGLVAQEERILVVLTELAEDKLRLVISSNARRPCARSDDVLILGTRCESFVMTIECLVIQLHSLSGTVKYIEDRYFDGLSILFKSSKILLKEIEERLAAVLELSNVLAPEYPRDVPTVDLENWRNVARRKSEFNCTSLVNLARADALSHLGDRSGAHKVGLRISEHLRSEC